MDRSIRVRLLDREYPLRVRAENEERTREIALAVDARMQAIRKRIPTEPDLTIAVMAAMAIAEELETAKAARTTDSKETVSEIESMLEALAAVVD